MLPEYSLLIASGALALYVYLFVHFFKRPDGRGRQYLLIVTGCLVAYFVIRVVGYCGLSWHCMSALTVNELFRVSGYVVIVPGVWIATISWRK